ncbi:serine/threonine-protein kinase [Delftia sp. GW456-R20]|uniref:serine/threonine-protein kinase n=1 Tax=Delftia sp. GW456-R20 TaxID=1827145 RepID=UPI0009EDC188|nr:serine/threonine-protein kinase [Delftia sp. GW456-R20]
MDSTQARQLTDSLMGNIVDGWKIDSPINHGKSAVVVRGSRGSEIAAIKVFHPELIERFGRDAQLERIARECTLVGENHPNLVKILGGGECKLTNHLYVAMEYLPWSNLQERLGEISTNSISRLISQLASAAMFLEERNLAHRDIKPENIAISEDLKVIKLLDLGVLRPFGVSDLTDADQRHFIGTLRYSSPEFLRRKEEPTLEGWQAVTIYQIGAVLHDLLTKEPLFKEFSEPFTLLVEAVLHETPIIWGDDPSLIPLCRHCLHKNPKTRLELVKWTDFAVKEESSVEVFDILAKIKNRQKYAQNHQDQSSTSPAETARLKKLHLDAFCNRMESRLSILINSLGCFPPKLPHQKETTMPIISPSIFNLIKIRN